MRLLLLLPRNIEDKSSSKTRDRKTYRATAAAGLGAAGDGRGAFGTGAVHVEYGLLLVVCG
jgi:hypothetical protein